MPSLARFAVVAALAIACHGAAAQTVVTPTLAVQRVAPQLVAFAGSQSNFQSLVTGLTQGTPVQLVTVLPDGFTQVVTFTPTAPMSPTQIAQVLETARQQLIGLGIASPTAEQIAVTLMGGVVPTALGGSQVAGVLNPQNPPSPAAQAQANAAAGASTSATPTTPAATTPSAINPPVNVQIFPGSATAAASNSAAVRTNTSDSPVSAGATSRSPTPAPISTSPAPTTTTPAQTTGGLERGPGTPPPAPATAERSGIAR